MTMEGVKSAVNETGAAASKDEWRSVSERESASLSNKVN